MHISVQFNKSFALNRHQCSTMFYDELDQLEYKVINIYWN